MEVTYATPPLIDQYTNCLNRTSNRQSIKLQPITLTINTRKPSKKSIDKVCKRAQDIHRGANAQSALMRQLKMLSLKAQNERIEEPSREYYCSPSRRALQKIENSERKKEQMSKDSRTSGCKSFMIRKKNISTHAKKLEEESTRFQCEFPLPIKIDKPQLPQKQQHLNSRRFPHESNRSINSNNSNQVTDKLHKNSFQTSVLNQPPLKIKPIFCKNRKKRDSEKASPSEQQHKQGSHKKIHRQIEKMIKKVRKFSYSEHKPDGMPCNGNESKNEIKITNNQKSDSADQKEVPREGKDKKKAFSGCKTIRIFWGETKEPINGPVIKQQEKAITNSEKIIQPDSDDIFGSISIITARSDAQQLESLTELCQELGFNQKIAHQQ